MAPAARRPPMPYYHANNLFQVDSICETGTMVKGTLHSCIQKNDNNKNLKKHFVKGSFNARKSSSGS